MSNKLISRNYALKLRAAGKATFVSYVKADDADYVNINRHDTHETQCFKTDRLLADTTKMEMID